jgi:hypothetical protein
MGRGVRDHVIVHDHTPRLQVTGTALLMWNNVGTLALDALADRSSRVQTQLILGTDPSQGGLT